MIMDSNGTHKQQLQLRLMYWELTRAFFGCYGQIVQATLEKTGSGLEASPLRRYPSPQSNAEQAGRRCCR
ncbi:MAG: hypothetical protein CME15_13270 [Gemmatimonadetes bacterium]|jgi:hypothetical protein|nr:hypothetical protein [Gemmatimonadota bacterium]